MICDLVNLTVKYSINKSFHTNLFLIMSTLQLPHTSSVHSLNNERDSK